MSQWLIFTTGCCRFTSFTTGLLELNFLSALKKKKKFLSNLFACLLKDGLSESRCKMHFFIYLKAFVNFFKVRILIYSSVSVSLQWLMIPYQNILFNDESNAWNIEMSHNLIGDTHKDTFQFFFTSSVTFKITFSMYSVK